MDKPQYNDANDIQDLILFGGKVYTMDGSLGVCEAIGVKDGKISFMGSNAEAAKWASRERMDLAGKSVLPGFNESHIHCVTYAWYENCVKLQGAASKEEVAERTKAYISERVFGDGAWVIGRGWNQDNFKTPDMLTKNDLDAVCADIPIALLRTCGHICSVNSKALALILGLDAARALADEIDTDRGILYEGAARLFMAAMEPLGAKELSDLIRYAAKELNACGITSIHSDDLRSLPVKSKYETVYAFRNLSAAGELNVRVCCLNSYDSPKQLDEYIADGFKTGMGDEMFRIGPVKIITDGSLGGKTAALIDPYPGTKDRGLLHYSLEELIAIVDRCAVNGLDVTIHAIGDLAMRNAALAVKASNEAHKSARPRRHGVLHAQAATAETLAEMGRQQMTAFIQPVFVGSDMDSAESKFDRPAAKKLYAWKSMREAGMCVAGSACSPVERFNVLENIQYAVTREKLSGGPAGGWIPSEKLTVEEAVRLFTVNGAHASYEEDIKGSLTPGKVADFVILDGDIFETEPHKIKDLKIVKTILGGRTVYER
jgi:predicted amidohydrolase YtcJ